MKHSLLLSLLLFVCLGVFGQSSSVPPQKVTIDQLKSSIIILQDSIENLKADNADLHQELKRLQKTVDQYRDYVKTNTSSIENRITWWLGILTAIITLIVGGLGVVAPYLLNRRSHIAANKAIQQANKAQEAVDEAQTNLKSFQTKVQEATTQATTATAQAENARTALVNNIKRVEEAVKKVEKTEKAADSAAKKAKATQYFIQALQENDPDRAIEYYDNCIDLDPDFAEAYNKRGYLRYRKGEIDDAKQDFEEAIAKKENFAEAYNNLGVLLFSQKNFDDANENYDDAEDNFNRAGEYAEAILNLGLLEYANGKKWDAENSFDKAINLKPNFAEAFYIRGLYYLKNPWSIKQGIEDIIKAKSYNSIVIEAYPNQNLLTGEMKEWDNSFNRVEYSRDFKTLISVPKDKQGIFKIPNSVTVIGIYAFSDCTSLTSIKIPDSVTVIGESAFWGCTGIKNYIVSNNNQNYCSINGTLYSKDKTKLYRVPCERDSLIFPNSVTKIGIGAFGHCSSLTTIKIPNSVTVIGGNAFYQCINLTSIEIPNSVTKIENFAFIGCSSLTSIVIPDSVTAIGEGAFIGCSSLTSIVIPDSVTKIGKNAFWGCTNLTEIHLKHTSPVDFSEEFEGLNLSKITLYVPKGSLQIYKDSGYYRKFKIEEEKS